MTKFDDIKNDSEYKSGSQGESLSYVKIFSKKPNSNFWFILLLVLCIIIILSAVIMPHLFRARSRPSIPPCQSYSKNICTALQAYADDNGGQYPAKLKDLIPGYMPNLPVCKDTKENSYESTYTVSTNPDAYTFWCSCGKFRKSIVTGNFPQYTSEKGMIVK
jgi:competence protein ComGC